MMSRFEREENDRRLVAMFGDKAVIGYYTAPIIPQSSVSTLAEPRVTAIVPPSSRKPGIGEGK